MILRKILLITLLTVAAGSAIAQRLQPGVSKELAESRSADISKVHYTLTFNIPADRKQNVI